MTDNATPQAPSAPVAETPAAAPVAPATNSAPPVENNPRPTTAAERAMNEVNAGKPAKKTFKEIEAELNGTAVQTPPTNTAGQSGDGTQAGTGLPPQAGQPPSQQPAGQPQAPVESPVERELRAQLAAQAELLQRFAPNREAQPQAPAAPAQPRDTTPEYNFNVPEQFLQGMRSEDPAQASQALNGYTRAVMRTVHRQVANEFQGKMDAMVTQILPKMVQQYIEHNTVVRTVYEDFYGANKDLNKPELYPVVVKVAEQLMTNPQAQAQGFHTWGPKLRDAIAQQVRAIIGAAAPQQASPPARKQPALTTPGARPGVSAPTPEDRITNEIMALKGH